MGNSARDNNAYGAQARPAAVKQPTAMTKAPTRVPATWGPNGMVASWKEIPAPAAPAAPAARQQLATLMTSPTEHRWTENGQSMVSDPFRMDPNKIAMGHDRYGSHG